MLVLAVVAACTSTREREPARGHRDAPAPAVAPAPAKNECDVEIAEYLLSRSAANDCRRDEDCAEIWPGLCPHGPYYVNREGSDVAALLEHERRIAESCTIPECEPPMELGMASCDKGRCEPGRAAPTSGPGESCWDYRETYLEPQGGETGMTGTKIQGITPQLVAAPRDAARCGSPWISRPSAATVR
jgi:hypothetical protein